MFAPISAVFGFLLFASTLPNGIRLVELPGTGDSVAIVAGYTSGGLQNFTSTASARSLLFDAYAAGGEIEFINDLDRTAVRATIAKWALPMVLDRLPKFFQEVPKGDEGGDSSSDSVASVQDFRSKVEDEIRGALLGSSEGRSSNYATGDAFVLMSAPVPDSLRTALAAIPNRGTTTKLGEQINRLPAERTLRFKAELPAGAVIFASPIPGVFYKQWHLVLMLDRLIHRAIALPLVSSLPLTVRPYYYRLEAAVPAGQFPEPVEGNLLQELERLQFVPANARDLAAARQEALAYLDSKNVREWFASHDIAERRDEGVQWIESMTSDDMRVAVRDLLIANRVIATWAPKARQTSVAVESLTSNLPPSPSPSGRGLPGAAGLGEGNTTPFPPHTDAPISTPLAERLSSGVSLVSSSVNAVFVSGGPFTRFDHFPTADDLKAFQQYRAERILVLTPVSSIDRARQIWSSFRGSSTGELGVPKGKVSTGDLPALFILKTILDLRLIESASWPQNELRIDAGEGSTLDIRAEGETRSQILAWIKSIAMLPPAENYFKWVREVAIHRFDSVRADLQALTWERDPQGTIRDLETISPQHVQDVARIYF